MKITGPYKMDQNFIYVFVGDTKYIIAKNGDQWGSVTVGKLVDSFYSCYSAGKMQK